MTKIKQGKKKTNKKEKPKEIKSKALHIFAHVDKRKEWHRITHISESGNFYPAKYIWTRVITTGANIQLFFSDGKENTYVK